ncbi:MAG: VCBS repeat-containing protein [bacterium]|nr:VCBS repeat-containing protein [bacterium]
MRKGTIILFIMIVIFVLNTFSDEWEIFNFIDNLARENRYTEAFKEIEKLENNTVLWELAENQKLRFRNYHELYIYYLSKSKEVKECIEYIEKNCGDPVKYPMLNLSKWDWKLQTADDPEEAVKMLFPEFEKEAFLIAVAKDMNDNDDYYRYLISGYRLFRDRESSDKFKYEYLERFQETEFAIDLTREDYFSIAVEQDMKRIPELCDEFLVKHYIPYFQERVIVLKLYAIRDSKKKKEFEKETKILMDIDEYAKSPVILNAIAFNYLEIKHDRKKSLEYSTRAVQEIESGWDQDFYDHLYPEEVWEKMNDEFIASVYFNHARALLENNLLIDSSLFIKKITPYLHRGSEDDDTCANLYYLSGEWNEKAGEPDAAIEDYYYVVYVGDTRNRWAAKAEEKLSKLLKKKYGSGFFPFKKKLSSEEIFEVRRGVLAESVYGSNDILKENEYIVQGPSDIPVFKDKTSDTVFNDISASRISIGDFNNDGYDDILLNGNRLFRNEGDFNFIEITEETGLNGNPSCGGIWCDFNLDGLLDIYTISHSDNGDKLWIQGPAGVFKDRTEEYGNPTDSFPSEGCAAGDFNGDGWPDIYIANYEKRRKSEFDEYGIGTPDRLYINENGRSFKDISSELVPPYGEDLCSRGVSPCDFDYNGIQEIYISNYRLDENLFWDYQEGRFVNIADDLGINGILVDGYYGHTIGSAWNDFDNDGDMDLFCANLAHPRYIKFSNKSMAYLNDNGKFIDKRPEYQIKFEETHSDPVWFDYDLDGNTELYITSIYPNRRSFFYGRADSDDGDNNPIFKDLTYESGVRVFNGWGTGVSDFDNDGDVDLFVCSGSGVKLFENLTNTGSEKNFIQVRFIRGESPKICEAGIRGVLTDDLGEIQIREVVLGRGTTSQDSPVLFFAANKKDKRYNLILILPVTREEIKIGNILPGDIIYFNLSNLNFSIEKGFK